MVKKFFSIAALLAVTAQVSAGFERTYGIEMVAPEVIAAEIESQSAAAESIVASAPAPHSYATQALASVDNARKACSSFLAQSARSVAATCAQANKTIDTNVIARMPWFASHSNALTASKVAVATVVIAATAYIIKKAYDKVMSYKALKASVAKTAQK